MESSQELYNILKFDRSSLSIFLKNNCKYDYLKSLLINIESTNNDEDIRIEDLFLGKLGPESNKQRAIYELPTEELLTILEFICDFLNIKHVEEIAAGQGLLSCMLKYHLGDDYTVNATDGSRWMETNFHNKYYPVASKLFLSYCLDNTINFDDNLVIVSWPPEKDISDFLKFIEIKNPKNIVIIGCPQDKYIINLRSQLNIINYSSFGIPVKQLCYRDYFKYNNYFPKTSSRSSIIFATRDTTNINNMLLQMKLKHNDCLCQKVTMISDKLILQDIIVNYFKNYYLVDSLHDNQKFKELLKYCLKLLRIEIEINFPKYLKKYSEFIFWATKIIKYKYPLKITTREKFKEYKTNINILEHTENPLTQLKENGIIPIWVNNIDDAEKCIWLEFSYSSKKWKESRSLFINTFNAAYSQNTVAASSYVSFTSFTN